jgi:hypothetical protein
MRAARVLPLLLLAGCTGRAPAASLPAPDPVPAAIPHPSGARSNGALSPPDSTDYAIYSAVLRDVAQGEQSLFLVMDSTHAMRMDDHVASLLEDAVRESAPEAAGLVAALLHASEARHPLRPAFALDRDRYRLMSDTEFRALFGLQPGDPWNPHTRNGWEALARQHPGAGGQHEFSRVGYDHTRETALVFYRNRCGNICAWIHYVVLRRGPGDAWKVRTALTTYTQGDDHTYDAHGTHGMRDTVVAGIPQGPTPPASAPPPSRKHTPIHHRRASSPSSCSRLPCPPATTTWAWGGTGTRGAWPRT